MPDATLAASYQAYNDANLGRIRRLRRIRHVFPQIKPTRQPADNHTRHCHHRPRQP